MPLRWRHNGRDGVSNHRPHDCLLNRLFRRRWKTTSKLRVTVLCVGNSPGTGEFPAQMASKAENVSISWRHHDHVGKRGPRWIWISYIPCSNVKYHFMFLFLIKIMSRYIYDIHINIHHCEYTRPCNQISLTPNSLINLEHHAVEII